MHHHHGCHGHHGHHWHHGCCPESHSHGDEGDHEGEEHCHGQEFFMLAKEAWKELMIDKIKAEMDKAQGDKLNRLAKLISDTKVKKWQAVMQMKQAKGEFEEQLKQIMKS